MKQPKKQSGLTLIELMVTLAISSVILAGVVNIYMGSLSQAKLTTNLSSMQESGRFALEVMARDIRMAGYTGCTAHDDADPDQADGVYQLYKRAADNDALLGLAGNEWSGSGYASTSLTPMLADAAAQLGTADSGWISSGPAALVDDYDEAIANSDVIQVWTTGELAVDVRNFDPKGGQVAITLDAGHGLKEGDVVMFTNCGNVVVAQICNVGATQATISAGSSATCNNDFATPNDISDLAPDNEDVTPFEQGLETYSFRDAIWFVGKRDSGTKTPPSLFRGVNGVAREMVEGVENMQILYGVDTDHEKRELRTADKYVTADQVLDRWSDVVAVRVSVLIRSFEKGVADDSYEFTYNGRKYTATDGYLRQAYSTTIAVRNRNIGYVEGLITTATP